jgi:hypothetical protein
MELDLQRRPSAPASEAEPTCGEGSEQIRDTLEGILAEADRILDGLRPVNAEEYLQQNRQQGGQ